MRDGRRFTKNDWPKKPAKLDPDCFWVSVEAVKFSTGVREDELAWGTEVIDPRRIQRMPDIAESAAEDWYNQTDQSGVAELTLIVEDAKGMRFACDVRLDVRIESQCLRQRDVLPLKDANGRGVPPPPPPAPENVQVKSGGMSGPGGFLS